MVSGSANGNPSSMTTTATMEGPMPYVDCFGEPPLLDDKETGIVDSNDDMCSFTKDFAAYNKQVFESDGFDVDFYPGFARVCGAIRPVYCSKEAPAEEFSGCAEFAIKEYNKKKGIEKVNLEAAGTFNCYMTFTAVDEKAFDDEPKIFQALVTTGLQHKDRVELCRQKGDPSEGYYTDFGYEMVAKV